MKEEGWAQCQCCGELHKIEVCSLSEDDLFIKEYCPHCRDETKHLLCGDQDEIYINYNANIDPRHFIYNTK
jgi:hypothetical protein